MTTDLDKRAHDVTIYSDFHAITSGKSSIHRVWEFPLILLARAINRPDPILPSVPSFYDGLSNQYSQIAKSPNIYHQASQHRHNQLPEPHAMLS